MKHFQIDAQSVVANYLKGGDVWKAEKDAVWKERSKYVNYGISGRSIRRYWRNLRFANRRFVKK